jgi:hypothetical protein
MLARHRSPLEQAPHTSNSFPPAGTLVCLYQPEMSQTIVPPLYARVSDSGDLHDTWHVWPGMRLVQAGATRPVPVVLSVTHAHCGRADHLGLPCASMSHLSVGLPTRTPLLRHVTLHDSPTPSPLHAVALRPGLVMLPHAEQNGGGPLKRLILQPWPKGRQ